jgi:hypothetical protein
MFDLILSWHVLVSYHGLSTLCTTETNLIGQTTNMFDLILSWHVLVSTSPA